jgi:hypothetical protein
LFLIKTRNRASFNSHARYLLAHSVQARAPEFKLKHLEFYNTVAAVFTKSRFIPVMLAKNRRNRLVGHAARACSATMPRPGLS